ncbi:MAG: hypothetical protein L3J36_15285 [Rhodobacteraceae bacterium]|nr:hypothetical protein [Paracoccaceae bacterium]
MFLLAHPVKAADISQFVGSFTGSAMVESSDGTSVLRDMNVKISKVGNGFNVQWTSSTHKPDGRIKSKSTSVKFVPTDRSGIYAAAMKKNVFGHDVQHDPMKGEPFVWGRIVGDTLTVFSLYVDEAGSYEMQQYDRTLAEGGLQLRFSFLQNGGEHRSVSTFLKRH